MKTDFFDAKPSLDSLRKELHELMSEKEISKEVLILTGQVYSNLQRVVHPTDCTRLDFGLDSYQVIGMISDWYQIVHLVNLLKRNGLMAPLITGINLKTIITLCKEGDWNLSYPRVKKDSVEQLRSHLLFLIRNEQFTDFMEFRLVDPREPEKTFPGSQVTFTSLAAFIHTGHKVVPRITEELSAKISKEVDEKMMKAIFGTSIKKPPDFKIEPTDDSWDAFRKAIRDGERYLVDRGFYKVESRDRE